MNYTFEKIKKILDSDSKKAKISLLESFSDSSDPKIIKMIISKLDDSDIEVRGEAFSTLVLNENKISKFLIYSLNSENKNVRGFSTLVLANRNDKDAVPSIIKLIKDESSMVRSCALGALGFLRANKASKAIHSCFSDLNLEVKKSALKAAIDIGDVLKREEFNKFKKENDSELDILLVHAKHNF